MRTFEYKGETLYGVPFNGSCLPCELYDTPECSLSDCTSRNYPNQSVLFVPFQQYVAQRMLQKS